LGGGGEKKTRGQRGQLVEKGLFRSLNAPVGGTSKFILENGSIKRKQEKIKGWSVGGGIGKNGQGRANTGRCEKKRGGGEQKGKHLNTVKQHKQNKPNLSGKKNGDKGS